MRLGEIGADCGRSIVARDSLVVPAERREQKTMIDEDLRRALVDAQRPRECVERFRQLAERMPDAGEQIKYIEIGWTLAQDALAQRLGLAELATGELRLRLLQARNVLGKLGRRRRRGKPAVLRRNGQREAFRIEWAALPLGKPDDVASATSRCFIRRG
ncbi:MAG TPA: hypothetical protein VKX28_26095 [Xanthobacteraceae bacterium]|nr:hypothetical protein [Xanthobacteraceae bacterium]